MPRSPIGDSHLSDRTKRMGKRKDHFKMTFKKKDMAYITHEMSISNLKHFTFQSMKPLFFLTHTHSQNNLK